MKPKMRIWEHILNIVLVALIVESFLCTMMLVRKYAREDCLDRIEEATVQMTRTFTHAMDERMDKLTVFADILAANSENPEEQLQGYMENFCRTQYFSAVCIHGADGSVTAYGEHLHGEAMTKAVFAAEVKKLPYVSEVFEEGAFPNEHCIYQAVPIIRDGETIAVLYGYMTLDVMPDFVVSTAYDGRCQLYVVDGATGDFLMDEYHDAHRNLYDGSLGIRETAEGYSLEQMREAIWNGQSGFFGFRSKSSGEWYYTYYMPTGINNWMMQLTIDEETAFASYHAVSMAMMVLAACVIVLMFIHICLLMLRTTRANKADQRNLRKSQYINEVQSALLNAHNNPEYVSRALKTVANELRAETALLLSFDDKIVRNVYYWPSKDRLQSTGLLGCNVQDEFPVFYDILIENKSAVYYENKSTLEISETAKQVFKDIDVRAVMLTPILDTAGHLKGAICTTNMVPIHKNAELLECITYDLYMAITNIESRALIERMGMVDLLTNVKNRNSYEKEAAMLAGLECENLWCVFIDVNGLHVINNTQGHKAGDLMLCAVASCVKQAFGDRYTYRIGGDEFLIFAADSTREELEKKRTHILKRLEAKGYHIAIGFEAVGKNADGVFDVEQIVAEAEAVMYRDKKAYYQRNNLSSDRHYMG